MRDAVEHKRIYEQLWKQVAEQLGISPLMVEEYCEFSDLDCRLF